MTDIRKSLPGKENAHRINMPRAREGSETNGRVQVRFIRPTENPALQRTSRAKGIQSRRYRQRPFALCVGEPVFLLISSTVHGEHVKPTTSTPHLEKRWKCVPREAMHGAQMA